ncbi:hypothetical protein VPNG_01412 [Cytospora leucostoma]|uniref:Uncharacterized protein n=1 Tax=Cytospora leucostoma TaxID=1230097 RepID=A0A423XLB5_9PEZI|nr:hypothetical protein VPNG_01412 [Cytospora leucostoma]
MQDVTASTSSQLLLSPDSPNKFSPLHNSQALTAWRQRSEGLRDDIRSIVDGIRVQHKKLSQKFRAIRELTPNLQDFKIHFEVAVEDGHLFPRIKETFRKGMLTVAESVNYYGSKPIEDPPDVMEVRDRLGDILGQLENIEEHLGEARSKSGNQMSMRRLRKETKRSKPLQAIRSAIHKPVPQYRRRGLERYFSLPTGGASSLSSKMRLLLQLVQGLQEFMVRRLAPPSGERERSEPYPVAALPEEVELAQVAAAMLYESLGNVCPNPNHDFHNVRFRLGTQESIQVIRQGTKKGRFGLRVAFENSTTSQTWFDVVSIVTAREEEHLLDHLDQTLDAVPDLMETDTDIESATSDRSYDLLTLSRQPQQSRPRSGLSFSALRSERSVEHTANFCLYNYQQQTKELAARLKHSEVCEHHFNFPQAEDLNQVTSDGVQIQSLCALIRGRLSHRDRIRLARIIAESVLKFNSTEWLRGDLDGENVIVYQINKKYEPHLRVQITKPGPSKTPIPGGDNRMGHIFLNLAGILSDIALGASGRTSQYSDEKLYGKLKKQLNIGYADVVRECQNIARMQSPDTGGNEAIMAAFYNKVVSSLKALEETFEVS